MSDTGEIIRSGALTTVTDLLKTLAGPAFEEFGAILGDKAKIYRLKNFIKTAEKSKQILDEAGLKPESVPSRLLLPIIENCSVEDNDDLQERWAGLLASASQESDSLSPSFVETLKQLTPREAKHLDYVFAESSKGQKKRPTKDDQIPYRVLTAAAAAPAGALETYERLGLIRRDYAVSLDNRASGFNSKNLEAALSDIESALDSLDAEVKHAFCFTAYALSFFRACRGPRKQ
jgi:hypothetical protein